MFDVVCGSVKLCMMKVITLVKAETIAMKKEKRFYVLKFAIGFCFALPLLSKRRRIIKPITRVE